MQIPIEDAVTVAYVDLIHALSELSEPDVESALEDVRRAVSTLKPHVRQATTESQCLDCGKFKWQPGVRGICGAWHVG